MKNILLVDCELKYIDSVLNYTDITISVLITMKYNDVSRYEKNPRVKKIIFDKNFDNNDDLEYFEYNDIQKFSSAQLKSEYYFKRKFLDYQYEKYSYYRGLALVKKIFVENVIDAVIICNLNHGLVFDSLIVEMSNLLEIPNFNIGPMIYEKLIIYDNLHSKILEVNSSSMDYNNSLFYKINFDDDKFLWNSKSIFKNTIRKLFYKFGGWLGLEFLWCVRRCDLGTDDYGINYIDRLSNYLKLKILKWKLDRNSSVFNKNINYIFFALHLEPEATISDRAIMDSQIIAIKMLANSLPEGWKIYVKEHPHQFQCNTVFLNLFLYNSIIFKSKKFYNEIRKLKNVEFIKTSESSEELIKYSKAVATMSGTVILEAAKLNKPVMIFSAARTIYNDISGFYKITSYKDCEKAVNDILKRKYINYSDIDKICSKYLIEDNKNGYNKAINIIYNTIS